MKFSGNNSYYNDQEYSYTEPCFFDTYLPPSDEWTYEDFRRVLNEMDEEMLVNPSQQPQNPSPEYSACPMMLTDFPVNIPSNSDIQDHYNDGCTYEKLLQVNTSNNGNEEGELSMNHNNQRPINPSSEYNTCPVPVDFPLIPSHSDIQDHYNDGCIYKELLQVNPSNNGNEEGESSMNHDIQRPINPSSEYNACPVTADFPLIPSHSEFQEDYNDGWFVSSSDGGNSSQENMKIQDSSTTCTFEKLWQVLNEDIIESPSPNMSQWISCSSSSDWYSSRSPSTDHDHHQPKNDLMKRKRRRRASVRFADLIIKKKLSVGEKVEYRRRKKKRVLGAGIVKEMGIECCCCGTIYSISNFEEHTILKFCGKASHRPCTHIYIQNGKSLENLQSEIINSM